MRTHRRRTPSPALVIALIALFAALGGTGVAATKYLSPKSVKKNSIPGDRLKSNTVTGKQVKESTLGKVPSAASADSATTATTATNATNATNATTATNATNATNATTAATATSAGTAQNAEKVGGVTVKHFSLRVASDAAAATVLQLAGVTVSLACPGGDPVLTAKNTSGADDMLVRGTFVGAASADLVGTSDLDQTDPPTTLFNGTAEDRGSVSFGVARDGGPSMLVQAIFDDTPTYGSFTGCSIVGNATSS